MRRRRSFRTAVNGETMLWLGPRDPASIDAHFRHYFKNRSVELDGDIFLQTGEEDYSRFMAEMAKAQGNYARAGECLGAKAGMTAIGYRRWKSYEAVYHRKLAEGNDEAFVTVTWS